MLGHHNRLDINVSLGKGRVKSILWRVVVWLKKNDTRSGKGDRPLSTFFLAFSICGLSYCGKATLFAENSV